MSIVLAVDANGEPPTAFRIFVKGWNQTEKGNFLFDDAAAKSVMSAYQKWGVDLAIDLEHQMLDDRPQPDPTARDARGYCKLELRADGSLWAVDVRWTPDGAERLAQKRQRYVSPAFELDPETKRISKVLNIAITSMPATHNTPALVAASAGASMDPSLVKQALEAIAKGDAKSALDILTSLVASAAGADPEPDGDEGGSEGEGADPPPEEAPPEASSAASDKSATDKNAPDQPGGSPDMAANDPKKKTEARAMSALLLSVTGKNTLAEALAEVDVYRTSHLTLESERQKLAVERQVLEAADRRKLCIELITMGAEFPATVWKDPLAKAKSLNARWQKMPIAELRSHVTAQRSARGKKAGTATTEITPPTDETEGTELTSFELSVCKSTGCDPKVFASLKAFRDGKKGMNNGSAL